MEQRQRKIGGKGFRKNEDRISELPEDLLLHILSSFPTVTVIATSVLSKRWKSLWKMVPNLIFDSDYQHNTFREIVPRTLLLHKAPVLEGLHLEPGYVDALEMEIWIEIAFARHVRKLVLIVYFDTVKFPDVLGRCNNALEFLKLEGFILLNLPSPVGLKSLRELHLCYVNFKDEESVSNLLCGCPCLEDLVVKRRSGDDVETFTIAVPSLQRLTLEDEYYGDGVGGYVINAPSLKYLNIQGCYGHEFCLIENASELVEAKIIDVCDIANENFPLSLTSVKRLYLDFEPLKEEEIKYPTGIIFSQLVYLELHVDNRCWKWNQLSLMLDSSPKLQILKLIFRWVHDVHDEERLIDLKWNQPKCVPECLLFHLETFVWTGYQWQRGDDKEVATYILNNARRLKKATLSTISIESKELEKLEKRREMLKELASVVRASNSCQLVCEADTHTL